MKITRRFISSKPLALATEVSLAILLKLFLLGLLWWVCFQHPLPKQEVGSQLAWHVFNINPER